MRNIPIAMLALAAAALLAADFTPARAQQINPNGEMDTKLGLGFGGAKRKDAETEEREKKIDSDYQAARRAIPEQKAPSDPWGNIRGNETPAQTTAKKKK